MSRQISMLVALGALACGEGVAGGGPSPWAQEPETPSDVGAGEPSPGGEPIPGGQPGGPSGGPAPGPGAAPSNPAAPADPGSTPGATPSSSPLAEPDVGRVPIHRLNNTEYDNTVRDLLGVTSRPGSAFIASETSHGFDNIAAAFGMNDARYEQYFNAADKLVDEAFADDALRARILLCDETDDECAGSILRAFALRALRRPPSNEEIARLLEQVHAARELGEGFEGAIAHALKALLSSAQFLYRIELDPNPASAEEHALGPYELASRLSYLIWSSSPDDELYERAESGALVENDMLSAELGRLLSHERASQFRANFAGQWLGLRSLQSHQVNDDVFPEFDENVRSAMIAEGLAYFDEFLSGERPVTEFFTADVNFVNAPLAELYGLDAPRSQTGLVRVSATDDARRGFLGLASFLTLTSFAERTAPTLRGKWVLENLLCAQIAPPPAAVPELDVGSGPDAEAQNVRQRLEQHREDPECAGCHRILDPIGLGLENFDAIGRYRTEYTNGDAVDATGSFANAAAFSGLLELSELLAADTRFTDCVVQKLMTYALSRELVASDGAYLAQIRDEWALGGLGLRGLLEQIVQNDTFRKRRGEPG